MRLNIRLPIFALLLLIILALSVGCDDAGEKPETLRSTQQETIAATPVPATALPQQEIPSEIRPEFKSTMDSYEAFFDEYCRFIKKYTQSGYPMDMLSDYMRFMSRYADCMAKLEAMDDGTLSDAELVYYTEVMLRISQKLASCY